MLATTHKTVRYSWRLIIRYQSQITGKMSQSNRYYPTREDAEAAAECLKANNAWILGTLVTEYLGDEKSLMN